MDQRTITHEGDEIQPNSTAEFKLGNLQPVDIKANNVEFYSSNKKTNHASVTSTTSMRNIKGIALKSDT